MSNPKVNPRTAPSDADHWRSGQSFWLSPGGALHPVTRDTHSGWAMSSLGRKGDPELSPEATQAARDLYDLGWKRVTTAGREAFFQGRYSASDTTTSLSRAQLTTLKDLALSLARV